MPYFIAKNSTLYNSRVCSTSCPSAKKFLYNLADKLTTMTKSIDAQIKKIIHDCETGKEKAQGAVLTDIDTPKYTIVVKEEYLIYIRRYGPPENGIFNEDYLNIIRRELNIA